ncbi:MAG: hypothetical protein ACLGHP_07110 [Vicinamibacteria bacterium]
MRHLTPDEFVDLVDGALAADRVAHVEACAVCREEAGTLRAMLAETADVEVPEPTPAEWAGLSARIAAAVEAEPAPGWGWLLAWLRAPVLVPVAGVAALVLALVVSVDRFTPSSAPVVAEAPLETHEAWPAMEGFLAAVDPRDPAALQQIGLDLRPGWTERVLDDLTQDEWRELERLVELEVGVP